MQNMTRLPLAWMLFITLAAAEPEVRLTRDLTKFPAGSYEIVQTYDLQTRSTLEEPGKELVKEGPQHVWNTLTYDLVVKPPLAVVTVRRIQIRVKGKQTLDYDSTKPVDEKSEYIREQFRRLVGRSTRVDLAAYGRGASFKGLDPAFEEYLKANPDRAKWAEANRRNYGDARIDRLFARGLDVLFGADAGRASGKTRALTLGQAFEVKLERPGIGWVLFTPPHSCRVRSIEGGRVVVDVTWKENGVKPKVEKDGTMVVRGGDIVSKTALTYHAASGLLVGMEEEIKRTDQVAVLPTQRTWYRAEKTGLTIRKK